MIAEGTCSRCREPMSKHATSLRAGGGGLVCPEPYSPDKALMLGDGTMMDAPPVDRSQRTLTDGSPVTEDHREIDPTTGMQKGYVVLSAEERAKGFVRPVRTAYKHLTCGAVTTMGIALAETYARDPKFYSGTFCATCRTHFPLDQFRWAGTDEAVGS